MVKAKKTTQSAKRYTFQSFRDRVDSIKIEPSKRLNIRAFDEVDDSHFLSSLERWTEFNRSGNFTQFVFDVRSIAQGLPQIIFFKEKIFDLLADAIMKQDAVSLQPLLELLTQFCHDLGPDFMVFYERSVTMITQLALGENDSNTLEWEFNALAFIFKYLSKTLSQDLLPTFSLLEPLLKSKAHIARFCSEALSFLIRKTGSKQLSEFTNFAFDKIEDDIQYQKSFVILFSEALKSTKGSIHSKSSIILGSLIDRVGRDESSSAVADILIDIIGHGTQENVNDIYKLVLMRIQPLLESDPSFLNHYLKVLISLVFADSGKKIVAWESIIEAVQLVIKNFPGSTLSQDSKSYTICLLTLLVRNCEIQALTKSYNSLFSYSMTLEGFFLPFMISLINVSREKSLKFGQSFVQAFINKMWQSNMEEIGLFIQDLNDKDLLTISDDPTKFKIVLPQSLSEVIYKDLNKLNISDSKDLYEAHWRLALLATASKVFNSNRLIQLFQKVDKFNDTSKFKNTILARIISLLVQNNTSQVRELIFEKFDLLSSELEFVTSVTTFLRSSQEDIENPSRYIQIVSRNLLNPSHEFRLSSLYLISALASKFDETIVTISNQAAIVEQLPLVLSNGRDIGIRLRSFAAIVRNLDTKDDLRSEIFLKFLFGLLTVRFQPTWEAVLEVLPSTAHKHEQLVWDLAYDFITKDIESNSKRFFNFINDSDSAYKPKWTIIEPRLESSIDSIANVIDDYRNKRSTLLSVTESKYDFSPYPEFIRTNSIKILKSVPHIAERNSSALVSIALNTYEDGEKSEDHFSRKDQTLIYEIFSAFKKLQKIPKAQELRENLLRLLSSKTSEIRKTALDVLMSFHNKVLNKYKDSMNNLLDDAVFRDELSKIFAKNGESDVEDADLDEVMPIVLRILFGRAQTIVSSGNKKGLKVSSIQVLASMETKYVEQFLGIVSEKIYYDTDEIMDFENVDIITIDGVHLRRCLGYVNLLADIINTLGEKFVGSLPLVIKPLLLTLVQAQGVVDSEEGDEKLVSVSKSIRQSGVKDLLLLFKLLREFDWDEYIETIYEKILAPRFPSFEFENLQQASSMLKILVCWSEHAPYHELLLINDLEPASKILTLLFNSNTKQDVVSTVFDFAKNVITLVPNKGRFSKLHSLIAEKVFGSLDQILDRLTDHVIVTKAIDLLLALVEKKHVKSQERRSTLVDLATKLLEKPGSQISKQSKIQVLQTLKVLIQEFEGDFEEIRHLYEVSSRFLKQFTDKQQRQQLVEVFVSIGEKFDDYIKVASLVEELNAFSRRGMNEYDYERRLSAYREINDDLFSKMSALEWLPLLNNSLYFICEEDDLSVRTSASYTLRRYIDAFSTKESKDPQFIHYFKDILLPNLRIGLRSKVEVVQTEFIALLAHIVTNGKYVEDFEDMRILLPHGNEESDFFSDIVHIQLHSRQKAIKRLGEASGSIKGSNIAHYLLPIIENYAYCSDEKMRNVSNDAIDAIEHLVSSVTYKQFLAVFKRYLSGLKEGSDTQRDSVNLIVTISKALSKNIQNKEGKRMEGLPTDQDALDVQIEKEMITPVSKILSIRNEETILHRTPLITALASLVLGLSHDRIVFILPAVLTKICQILRTRHDDLRDAIRKYLGRASNILGAKYIKFIIQELKTALGKGFQVHVLGFTVNSILLATELEHGDLDDSASVIMDVVMDNLFGSTAQEKEADGYRNNMKEVRHNKSFDTAEILSRLINLSHFGDVISPVKRLLRERITFRIQSKLDELLRRLSLGVYKNDQLATQGMLVLCYELFQEAKNQSTFEKKGAVKSNPDDEHFMVQLDSKPLKVENGSSAYFETFQKMSLELLKTTLSKVPDFISSEKLTGFLPCFEQSLQSDNELVLVSVLRILSTIVQVQFEGEDDIFHSCAQKCLSIIKDYPSTESELVQSCFKYLSIIIRHRDDLALNESSLGYLLVRIQPDLNEQSRQGLAFNFLKAIIAKHIIIPEVYDTMDKVREVMVTSHSKERRDMSRSIYFKFIMEYDQGRGRLEKQFKFLVDNLSYPAEEGKQSVMELIHLIIGKSGPQLLEALSSSFFVGLAKVLISDTEAKTREMSVALITSIFEKMGTEQYEKYIIGWMNSKNSALLKCSLQLYRIKLKVSMIDKNNLKPVDEDVLINIKDILERSRSDSEIEVSWELIYSALNCLIVIVDDNHELIDEDLKDHIISALLYPHSWIRLVSSRLVSLLISKENFFDASDIQNISNRLLHQLRAPMIEESLGAQAIKFLTFALMKWEKEGIYFDKSLIHQDTEEVEEEGVEDVAKDDDEIVEETEERKLMRDWVIMKMSSIIRSVRVSHVAKKSSIQFLALSVQIMEKAQVSSISETLIFPLFNLSDDDSDSEPRVELRNLSLECLNMIKDKIGVSEYTEAYSKVRTFILKRRQERRTKRSVLAITAPEAAARRKIKKHSKIREKRKQEKDANGLYHTKKKRTK